MNTQQLYRGVTEIDDALIEEALESPHQKRRRIRLFAMGAACLALISGVFFALRGGPAAGPLPSSGEIYVMPRWEDMPLYRQYGQIDWDGANYYAACPVDAGAVGALLGGGTASGHDVYEDRDYSTPCAVYALSGISPAAAVAVRYESRDGFYTCRAGDYSSDTLGDLIDDLGLEQNLELGLVYYDGAYQDPGRALSYRLPDPAAAWDLLLGDRALKNEGSGHYTASLMGFSVTVEVLGIHNLSLSVNGEGYLQTNLISTGASYYIGEEKVRAFLDYVFTHGEVVEWPQIAGGGSGEPEPVPETEQGASAPSRPPAAPE